MYNNKFDKERIDYISEYFQESNVEPLTVTSEIIRNDLYRIRFENSEIVLQLFYEAESEDCEAQIRITNILIQGRMAKRGISKDIINKLINYCHKHNDMSLWIYDLINQSWKDYLRQHRINAFANNREIQYC